MKWSGNGIYARRKHSLGSFELIDVNFPMVFRQNQWLSSAIAVEATLCLEPMIRVLLVKLLLIE